MATLFPLLQRVGRRALRARGFDTRSVLSPLGPVFAYDARGRGSLPTIALLHGLGSAATPFAPLLMRLAPHVRRLVATDMPGHGFSGDATGTVTRAALFDAMHVALDELLTEPAVLVGNSLGGALAVSYAIARAERVRGLVLCSPAGAKVSEEDLRTVIGYFDFDTRAGAMAFMRRAFHKVPPLFHLVAHEMPEVLSHRRAVREIIASITAESMFPPGAVTALKMPVLFIWGKEEHLLPPSGLAWYRGCLPPQAIVEEPAGIGHVPPPGVAKRIVRFVRSTATS